MTLHLRGPAKVVRQFCHLLYTLATAARQLCSCLEARILRVQLRSSPVGSRPRIAFFTIVLNGEPWLNLNIEHIYKHASQIFIIEGATRADRVSHYWDGDVSSYCTADGHSIDNTMDVLRQIKASDKEDKVRIITREGPWNGKTEMCNSFLPYVDADYLWQLDTDEFYKDDDIEAIIQHLQNNPETSSVMFHAKYFFGSMNSIIAGQYGNGEGEWLRVFKYHKDFVWLRHEPPRYGDQVTGRTVETLTPLQKELTKALGIYMYHYSYVLEKTIRFKEQFFENPGLVPCLKRIRAQLAAGQNPIEVDLPKLRPFGDLFVVPFTGTHPEPIARHMDELLKLEIRVSGANGDER